MMGYQKISLPVKETYGWDGLSELDLSQELFLEVPYLDQSILVSWDNEFQLLVDIELIDWVIMLLLFGPDIGHEL